MKGEMDRRERGRKGGREGGKRKLPMKFEFRGILTILVKPVNH